MRIMERKRTGHLMVRITVVGLLLVGLVRPVSAHNGAMAIAVPVEGITVDGDLSDWPEGMRRYPIELAEGRDAPTDAADYQGAFRIGFNEQENALYIAVEVQDESTVIDATEGWDTQDGCEVYVDIRHGEEDSPAVQYALRGDLAEGGNARVQRVGNRHRYEWRIELITSGEEPVIGILPVVLGVDVVVCDKDEDGSFSWMAWGRGTFKAWGVSSTDKRGDVVLVEPAAGIGLIQGTIQWEDRAEGSTLGRVLIQSVPLKGLRVVVQTDGEGRYEVEVPSGTYQVGAGYRRRRERVDVVEVQAGRTVRIEALFFPRPQLGIVVKAGAGRVVVAGSGQGHWRTYGVPEGLADNIVKSIFQDREGLLWFGTNGGGVSRYEGQTFTTFTTQDGLAANGVTSIIQDREGALWFGTWDGVSRYEGKIFTSFTTQDGLVHNSVTSMVQDREGVLWFGTLGGGVSRYDGKTFTTFTTQDGLAHNSVTAMVQDQEGALWFVTQAGGVTRYRQPAPAPPPVFIDAVLADRRYEGASDLAIPSSVELTIFEFHGTSFKTRPGAMVYRYRLKGYQEDWKTTRARRVEYQDLPRGTYTFQVQAVDRDLVYSEAPATVTLTVHLPYERIGWISSLGLAFVLIVWQAGRIIQRDRKLREANAALSDGNRELFGLNLELQRDRALERIRAQVQTMEQASDFDGVLAVLAEDLKGVGLNFDTCGIDVLDETLSEPTMAYFETHGFRYTTYKLDPDGNVSEESYPISAPFPDVTRETIERFIAGQPWRGRSEQNEIVEVPVSNYGRLRITAADREAFTEEEAKLLRTLRWPLRWGIRGTWISRHWKRRTCRSRSRRSGNLPF